METQPEQPPPALMAAPAVLSAKDRIKGARKQRRSTRINLRGDLVAQIEQLEAELRDAMDAEQQQSRRLSDTSASTGLAERIEQLRTQMAHEWLDLTLEQRGWADWRQFKAANPPREDDDYDKLVGCNFDVLVQDFMPTCVIDPVLDAEDWAGLFERCAPADLRDLGAAVYNMHEAGLVVPKSRLSSAVRARTVDDSEPPERLA